ncbi:slr1306 family protein [Chroogloeocystis siderophila]
MLEEKHPSYSHLIMAVQLRRPILVGGVGLSFCLWILQSWHHSIVQLGEYGILGALTVGGTLWLFQQKTPKRQMVDNSPVTRETVEKAIAQAASAIECLAVEAEEPAQLRQQLIQLNKEFERQELRVAVIGSKAVGKTKIIQALQRSFGQQLTFQETPALFTSTDHDHQAETTALAQANATDLVLFVTNGDLTETEFQALQQLIAGNRQRTLLVFNKQDQHIAEERAVVLHALQQRMQPLLKPEDTVAIAASPSEIKVRQHAADGTIQEWREQPAPAIEQLSDRLATIATQERQQLIWATTQRQALALKAEAKTLLNRVRRDRAIPIIEQYQWIAAAAAFANPVPALDLLATAAINAQLVTELGAIYQQKFSLQQAQTVAGTMGSLMVKLGLVELSTKAVSTVLKSNAVTFVAGGAVQGVSAAYLTRLAGLSLVEYFQSQEVTIDSEKLNLDKLSQTLQKVFQQNQQVTFLQNFVKQGVERLLQKPPQPQLAES